MMTDAEAEKYLSEMLAKRRRDNIRYGTIFWGLLLTFLIGSCTFCWWAWKDVYKNLDELIQVSIEAEVRDALRKEFRKALEKELAK